MLTCRWTKTNTPSFKKNATELPSNKGLGQAPFQATLTAVEGLSLAQRSEQGKGRFKQGVRAQKARRQTSSWKLFPAGFRPGFLACFLWLSSWFSTWFSAFFYILLLVSRLCFLVSHCQVNGEIAGSVDRTCLCVRDALVESTQMPSVPAKLGSPRPF